MSETNGNDKINPTLIQVGDHVRQYSSMGLTKREYFAAMAMQGIILNHASTRSDSQEQAGLTAVEYADFLILALNKAPK